MNPKKSIIFENGKLLLRRLERLSADSIWARRASGLRGSLLREIINYEKNTNENNYVKLEKIVTDGFKMLEKAAKEIPDIESKLKEFE